MWYNVLFVKAMHFSSKNARLLNYLDTNTEIKAWQFVVCLKTGLLQLLKRITHVFSNYSLGSIIQKQSKLNKYEIANLQDIPLSVSRNSKKRFYFLFVGVV